MKYRTHILASATILTIAVGSILILNSPNNHPQTVQISTVKTTQPVVEQKDTVPTTEVATDAPAQVTEPSRISVTPQPKVYFSADSSQYPAGNVRLPRFTTDGNGYTVTTTSSCQDGNSVIFELTSGSTVVGPNIDGQYVGTNASIIVAPPTNCTWSISVTSS